MRDTRARAGSQRFRLDRRQPKALDERVLVEPLDFLAERQEPVARDLGKVRSCRLGDLRRHEADVAADGDDMVDATQRNLESDFLDDVGDVAPDQRELNVDAVFAEIELLAKAHRAERVNS